MRNLDRWAVLIWIGIAISAGALLVQAIVFRQGFGAFFWILGLLLIVAALLVWRAAAGTRWALLLLVLVSAVTVIAATFLGAFAIALSFSQVPTVELLTWTFPIVGSVAMLVGSLLGLRPKQPR